MEMKNGWMTIADAAEALGISPNSIRYWAKYKGLQVEPFTPDFGRKTTIVHIDDVKEIMGKRRTETRKK